MGPTRLYLCPIQVLKGRSHGSRPILPIPIPPGHRNPLSYRARLRPTDIFTVQVRVVRILQHILVLGRTVIHLDPFLLAADADPRRVEEAVGALHDLDQAVVLLAPLAEGVDEGLDVGVVRKLPF